MKADNFQKEGEKNQIDLWKSETEDVKNFFSRFDIDIKHSYKKLFSLNYDKVQSVIYLIGKIQKVMAVCDFLDDLAKQKQDVDKIKIFYLISHTEIAMNTFSHGGNKADLVKKYFNPVMDKLECSLRLSIESQGLVSTEKIGSSADVILYKLRNEYVHQGNFTGKIFHSESEDNKAYKLFTFDWDLQGKGNTINVTGETKLTYNQFLNIYFFAFRYHLENFVK